MLSDFKRAKFSQVFRNLDVNRDGVLGREDYDQMALRIAAVRGLEPSAPRHQALCAQYAKLWSELVAAVQPVDGERITLEEWVGFHGAQSSDPARAPAAVTGLADAIFEVLDVNGDGRISLGEYEGYLKARGLETGSAANVFNAYDADGDGRMTREELQTLAVDYYTSDDPAELANALLGPIG